MDSCSEQPSMMSQSDFLKNAGRWGGSDVAARHYRAAVLSNLSYGQIPLWGAGERLSRVSRKFGAASLSITV
jgi:hypothetical protein